MADVNYVILIGRLTRDAELKYTTSGLPIASLGLAVNRRRKNGEQWIDEASFFDVSLFGRSAESLKPYLVKGKQIAVEGELRQDRWEQDGQPRSKVVIAANNVQLLGGGQGSAPSSYAGDRGGYQPRENYGAGQQGYQEPYAGDYGAADQGFPSDIPF